MHTETPLHRHLLIVPLFLVFVVITLVSVFEYIKGDILSVSTGGLPAHVQVEDLQESVWNGQILTKGSSIVSTSGLHTFGVGSFDVTLIDGAAVSYIRGGSVTIAALTTPVLVSNGSTRTVIPVGMQWRGSEIFADLNESEWYSTRSLQSLPERYLREHRLKLSELLDSSELSLSSDTSSVHPIFAPLQLPKSKERQLQHSAKSMQKVVYKALRDGDRQRASLYLSKVQYHDQWDDAFLVSLLPLVSDDRALVSLILSKVESEDIQLLSLFHPAYRAAAWAQLDPKELSDESEALITAFFPQSDRSRLPLSDQEYSQWVSFVSTQRSGDIVYVLEDMLSLIDEHASQGLVVRSSHLSDAVLTLTKGIQSELSEDLVRRVASLEHTHVVVPQKGESDEVHEDDSSESEEEELSPEGIEQQAYNILQAHKALFTVETRIEAIAPHTARIENVLFSERLVSFSLRVDTEMVSSIERGGKAYPNALPMSAFLHWLTR